MSKNSRGWIGERKTYSFVLPVLIGDRLLELSKSRKCSVSSVAREVFHDYFRATDMLAQESTKQKK